VEGGGVEGDEGRSELPLAAQESNRGAKSVARDNAISLGREANNGQSIESMFFELKLSEEDQTSMVACLRSSSELSSVESPSNEFTESVSWLEGGESC